MKLQYLLIILIFVGFLSACSGSSDLVDAADDLLGVGDPTVEIPTVLVLPDLEELDLGVISSDTGTAAVVYSHNIPSGLYGGAVYAAADFADLTIENTNSFLQILKNLNIAVSPLVSLWETEIEIGKDMDDKPVVQTFFVSFAPFDGGGENCTGCSCPTGCGGVSCKTTVKLSELQDVCLSVWVKDQDDEKYERDLRAVITQFPTLDNLATTDLDESTNGSGSIILGSDLGDGQFPISDGESVDSNESIFIMLNYQQIDPQSPNDQIYEIFYDSKVSRADDGSLLSSIIQNLSIEKSAGPGDEIWTTVQIYSEAESSEGGEDSSYLFRYNGRYDNDYWHGSVVVEQEGGNLDDLLNIELSNFENQCVELNTGDAADAGFCEAIDTSGLEFLAKPDPLGWPGNFAEEP